MMAAMMLPSLVPAAVAFARGGERRVAAFIVGYLAAWTAAGLVAYLLLEAVRALDLPFLAWDRAGRYVATGVILAAAGYQLTAAKAPVPATVPDPAEPGGRGAAGSRQRPAGRGAARRVLHRLLHRADGGSVRARGDEPHVDGRGRSVDRRRAAAALGYACGVRRGRHAGGEPCSRRKAGRGRQSGRNPLVGPFDGFLDALACVTDAVGFGFLMGGFDRPAAVVARDEFGRGALGVGRGQSDVDTVRGAGVADQDYFDRPRVERLVPEADELVDVRGALSPVGAGDRDRDEGRGIGDLGEASEPGALQRRAALPGGCTRTRSELVQRRVRAHAGRYVHTRGEIAPRPARVRDVHHQLYRAAPETLDHHVHQQPPQLRLRAPIGVRVVLGAKQSEQDRQPDLTATEARKLHDQHDHDPAVSPPGALSGPLRLRAVVQVVRAPHLPARATEQRASTARRIAASGRTNTVTRKSTSNNPS